MTIQKPDVLTLERIEYGDDVPFIEKFNRSQDAWETFSQQCNAMVESIKGAFDETLQVANSASATATQKAEQTGQDALAVAADRAQTEHDRISTSNNSQIAAEAAEVASEAKTVVVSAANFKGKWTALSGPLNMPASVHHSDAYWQLVNDLADVTVSEPGVTSDWIVSGSSKGGLSIGQAALAAKSLELGDYLRMDGMVYQKADYPELSLTLPALNEGYTDAISGIPYIGNGRSVSVTQDGSLLAVADSNNLLVLDTSSWTIATGSPSYGDLGSSVGSINEVTFSPGGSLLAVVLSASPGLVVFNTADWSIVPTTPVVDAQVTCAAFSPSGRFLVIGAISTPYLYVIKVADWSIVPYTPNEICNALAFSPEGAYLAIASGIKSTLILDTSDWSIVPGTEKGVAPNSLVFSPDGALLAILAYSANGNHLEVMETKNWSLLPGVPYISSRGYSVRFSPDGAILAVGHRDDTPYLTQISVSDWSIIPSTPAMYSSVKALAFDPDNSYLAVGHNGGGGLTILNVAISDTEFRLPVAKSDLASFEWRVKAQ